MKVEKLKLSDSCDFTLTTFEGIEHKIVCLEYTEHATDHWNSDSETSIDLDAEKAREIIAFLHKAFPALAATPPAAQRQWVGLTDEERDEILDIYITAEGRARAIEAKLRSKNNG